MMEKLLDENVLRCKTAENNIKRIRFEIEETCVKSGRNPLDIKLLAATKTVPYQIINHCILNGLDLIGENRVQEFLGKYDNLCLSKCDCHFIGTLQTNKVRKIIDKVNMIQSVNSIKLAKEISRLSTNLGINMKILLEVNIGKEKSKSGILPEMLEETIIEISKMSSIKVCGLMCIPPICRKNSLIRKHFLQMRKFFIDIRDKKLDNINMGILSMGMSNDFNEAIMEGSNLIRIGSSIFGTR